LTINRPHDLFAAFPGENQRLRNRVLVQSRNAHRGANRVAFYQKLQGQQNLFLGSVHFAKSLVVRLGIRLAALRAAKPAKAIAVYADALTPHVARFASHCDFGGCYAFHDSIINYR
jgi:hypothetical protein